MRRTRFMSLVFFVWAIAFFFVPEFRLALQGPHLGFGMNSGRDWLLRSGRIPDEALRSAAQAAEENHDAQTLAFVAMRLSENESESLRLADEAVKIDPNLTWIYPQIYSNLNPNQRRNANLRPLLKGLEAWDPQNGFPYLLEGEQIFEGRLSQFLSANYLDNLARETEWRNVMQKAFAAPQYDSYKRREFDLDRHWLSGHGWAKPAVMILTVSSFPRPDLRNIRMYSDLLIQKVGKDAESAGHLPEALNDYWTVAHMGERLHLKGDSTVEQLIGAGIANDAYEHLIPLLRRTGQADLAATLEFNQEQLHQSVQALTGKDLVAQSSNYNFAGLIVETFPLFVAIFGVLTVFSMGYLNIKRLTRSESRGWAYQFITVMENYVPILLFLACLGLYLGYYPYARNFHHYMTGAGEIHDFDPLFYNILPSIGLMPGNTGLEVGNPFVPYVWYALAGLMVVVIFSLVFQQRARKS